MKMKIYSRLYVKMKTYVESKTDTTWLKNWSFLCFAGQTRKSEKADSEKVKPTFIKVKCNKV